jgi:ribonuclease T1
MQIIHSRGTPRAGLVIALLLVCATGFAGCESFNVDSAPYASDELQRGTQQIGEVAVNDLPPEARSTLDLIQWGGPFPYAKDGSTFHNYEGLLPTRADGYYREYTVETPGSGDRGARRIVAGEGGEKYYTDDHYTSFRRIVE